MFTQGQASPRPGTRRWEGEVCEGPSIQPTRPPGRWSESSLDPAPHRLSTNCFKRRSCAAREPASTARIWSWSWLQATVPGCCRNSPASRIQRSGTPATGHPSLTDGGHQAVVGSATRSSQPAWSRFRAPGARQFTGSSARPIEISERRYRPVLRQVLRLTEADRRCRSRAVQPSRSRSFKARSIAVRLAVGS